MPSTRGLRSLPLRTRRFAATHAPRLVLSAAVLSGLVTAVVFPAANPGQVALASDVYYAAGRAVLAGQPLYDVGFLYPPPIAVAFVPNALLGSTTLAYAFQILVGVVSLGAVAVVGVRLAERVGADLGRTDRWLVGAAVVASSPSVVNLVNGQVNPVLAAAVAAGVLAFESDREWASGVAFALAALVKLFPALVGAWLLRQRAWRAVAAATATGLGLLLAGLVLFGPAPYETFVTTVLTGEANVATFPDGPDASEPYTTIRRQLTAVAPGLSGGALLAASVAVLAPIVAAANRVTATLTDRLVGLHALLTATLVAFPLEPFYAVLAYPTLVPLLYALDGTPRRLFLVGSLLTVVPIALADVALVATLPVFPQAVTDTLLGGAETTFTYVHPPTIGAALTLAACVLQQHGRAVEPSSGAA
ncbi:glycosyltransferase family 87 protein [Halobacterium wangiae]|uniref:glycosyltransferase family 87 protein n=1 Tax=Halobacterium wangiae TaxID=2902623 RepID=UPI001E57D263|nr:glycosyltransferase family 87 protein [Halobacterium wangiae]